MTINWTEIHTIINWDLTANLITGIATLAATILVFFTLREMQRQRKSAYQPTITIPKQNIVYFEWDNNKVDDNPANFSCTEDEKEPHISPNIELFNIGMGPAKNIKLNWEFNVDFFETKLEELTNRKLVEMDGDKTTFLGELVTYSFPTTQKDYTLDYILPSNIKPELTKIRLPGLYIFYFAIYSYLTIKPVNNDDFNRKLVEVTPPLLLSLSFENIVNEGHSHQFIFTPKLLHFTYTFDKNLINKNLEKLIINFEVSEKRTN